MITNYITYLPGEPIQNFDSSWSSNCILHLQRKRRSESPSIANEINAHKSIRSICSPLNAIIIDGF